MPALASNSWGLIGSLKAGTGLSSSLERLKTGRYSLQTVRAPAALVPQALSKCLRTLKCPMLKT